LPELKLCSFEELSSDRNKLRRPAKNVAKRPGPRASVLLSISNPPPDELASLGLASVHLDDAVIRIARALLLREYDVLYGGKPREGFTDAFQDDSGAVVVEPRFINYLGWPHSRELSATQIADGFGVTRYAMITMKKEIEAARGDPWEVAK